MTTPSRSRSLAIVAAIYALATVVAAAVFALYADGTLWWHVVAADVAATIVVFAGSVACRNSSVYDAYWSVAPLVIVPVLLAHADADANLIRQLHVVGLVAWWGTRLTYNWVRQWSGMDHEDWRYVDIRAKSGALYWPVSLLGIHLFPTLLVLAGCLGLFPALVWGTAPFGVLDVLATVVTVTGIVCEMVADRQLHSFRARRPPREEILNEGLWAWSRHPNYFGEMTFWTGIALFGLAAAPDALHVVVGPLAMIALFNLVSLPMIEGRMLERRPHFREHMRRVSRVIPLPPKRA